MKGKYSKKKKNTGFRWVFAVMVLLILAVTGLWIAAMTQEEPELPPPETTEAPLPTETTVPVPETTEPQAVIQEGEAFHPINLGYGVSLQQVNKYTGIYMEDGSDQLVSGVMMILVTNTGEDDIQLMHIEVAYAQDSYHFQLTNLPAGSSAVLLEQSKKPFPEGVPQSAVASNVVVFKEKMAVDGSVYEITGADGMMNVKNISDSNITGDIFVYYKYVTQDILYGGITFRVTVQGGLKAGEIRQVMAGHFNPDNCRIIMVEAPENNGN